MKERPAMDVPHLHFTHDGNLDLAIPTPLNAIGIENLADLRSHEITREEGATLHLIRFRSGGMFRLLYTGDGDIKELSGDGIIWTLTEDSRLILRNDPEPARGLVVQ